MELQIKTVAKIGSFYQLIVYYQRADKNCYSISFTRIGTLDQYIMRTIYNSLLRTSAVQIIDGYLLCVISE